MIAHLTETHEVPVGEIVEALEIPRERFYSWRRSTKFEKRDDMAEKIISKFPGYFPEGWDDKGEEGEAWRIKILQEQVDELRKDKAELYLIIQDLRSLLKK